MSNIQQTLQNAMQIEGAVGVALVDWGSGMSLGTLGGGPQMNLEVAAAGNTQVVRAKMQTMKNLNLNDKIEDILITLGGQYHIIRPLQSNPKLFLYLALSRAQANLAMARFRLAEIEAQMVV